MALNLTHQTKVQYLRRLRDRFRDATRVDACRFANRMLSHLVDGDVTVVQMQTAWGMTAAQWSAKAPLLQAKADKWLAFKAATAAANNEAGD